MIFRKDEMDMSTLEKTISLLNNMTEKQIEIIYMYAQFIQSQKTKNNINDESLDEILDSIIGTVPDAGLQLDDYREERIMNRNGLVD